MVAPRDFILTGVPNTVHDINIRSLSEQNHDFYVTAEKDRDWALYANRRWRWAWEQFRLTELGGNRFNLFAYANGKYVCADFDDGAKLKANRDWAREWETFILDPLGNSAFGIRSAQNNYYVCAELDHDAQLAATRQVRASWETFEIRPAVTDPPSTLPFHPPLPYGGRIFTKRVDSFDWCTLEFTINQPCAAVFRGPEGVIVKVSHFLWSSDEHTLNGKDYVKLETSVGKIQARAFAATDITYAWFPTGFPGPTLSDFSF